MDECIEYMLRIYKYLIFTNEINYDITFYSG